jgi:choline-sulfatase
MRKHESNSSTAFIFGVLMPVVIVGILIFLNERVQSPAPGGNRYNVIFITVDTLRADHTPFLNYSRQTMPNTEEFFRNGINFQQAETVRTSTTPAYASMLTGLYPYRHGVRDLYFPLNQRVVTLPELLTKRNILTAGFVSSFAMMDKFSGLKQGFEIYDDFVFTKEFNRDNYERNAQDTVRRVLSWLQTVPKNRQFFLFIHLIDPHGPYHPPLPFRDHFKSEKKQILDRHLIPDYQYLRSELDLYRYIDLYDGEILYLDTELKTLYDYFKQKELVKNSWFLFAADHGESLSEHSRYFEHGFNCYEEESRVPFVWLPPLKLQPFFRSGEKQNVVSLVDIVPTVLEILGIDSSEDYDGESLFRVFSGSPLKNRFRFIEKHSEFADTLALRSSNAKLILNRFPSKTIYEYYDLSQDPEEKTNMGDHNSLLPQNLIDAIREQSQRAGNYRLPFQVHEMMVPSRKAYVRDHIMHELSDEDAEKLKALGYLNN